MYKKWVLQNSRSTKRNAVIKFVFLGRFLTFFINSIRHCFKGFTARDATLR